MYNIFNKVRYKHIIILLYDYIYNMYVYNEVIV